MSEKKDLNDGYQPLKKGYQPKDDKDKSIPTPPKGGTGEKGNDDKEN